MRHYMPASEYMKRLNAKQIIFTAITLSSLIIFSEVKKVFAQETIITSNQTAGTGWTGVSTAYRYCQSFQIQKKAKLTKITANYYGTGAVSTVLPTVIRSTCNGSNLTTTIDGSWGGFIPLNTWVNKTWNFNQYELQPNTTYFFCYGATTQKRSEITGNNYNYGTFYNACVSDGRYDFAFKMYGIEENNNNEVELLTTLQDNDSALLMNIALLTFCSTLLVGIVVIL